MVNFQGKLAALDTNIRATFKTTRDAVEDELRNSVYDITKVNGAVANILILDSAPGMREFKSERQPGAVEGTSQFIAPRKWEATLAVTREQIEDDDLGRVPAAVRKMAINGKKHYAALIAQALMKGFTTALDDGTAFFAAARGNLQTGVLNATNFEAARLKLALNGYKATALVVGPQNQSAAEQIINSVTINGSTNVLYKSVEVKVDTNITDTSWYVVASGEGILPLTIAERIAADRMVPRNEDNSDNAFNRDIYEWGLRGRYDAAYVDPKLIVGSTGLAG